MKIFYRLQIILFILNKQLIYKYNRLWTSMIYLTNLSSLMAQIYT